MTLSTLRPEHFAAMTRADASELFAAVDRVRVQLVASIRRIERSRRADSVKTQEAANLRADLDTLAAFAEALGTAHNLGGY